MVLGDPGELLDGVRDSGGGLVGLHEDGPGVGVLLERGRNRARIDGVAPLDLQGDRVDAVALRQLSPALAELAGVDDDRFVPAAEEVHQ